MEKDLKAAIMTHRRHGKVVVDLEKKRYLTAANERLLTEREQETDCECCLEKERKRLLC